MFKTYRKATRVAVLSLLFFFLFLAAMRCGEPKPVQRTTTSFFSSTGTFYIPDLLRENEEVEKKEFYPLAYSVPLLDLSSHILHLQTSYLGVQFTLANRPGIKQAPSFIVLHCVMLI